MWVRSYRVVEGWTRSSYIAEEEEIRGNGIGSFFGRGQLTLWRLQFDPGVIANDKEDGRIYILKFGALNYDSRWKPDNPIADFPTMQSWWEANIVYVRWFSNFRDGLLPAARGGVVVVVRYWVLCLIFSIWPAVVGVRWWKRKRKRPGMCRKCGYDLRASPERCPECGEVMVGASEVRG
jgi:hypothetical protein